VPASRATHLQTYNSNNRQQRCTQGMTEQSHWAQFKPLARAVRHVIVIQYFQQLVGVMRVSIHSTKNPGLMAGNTMDALDSMPQ